MMACDISLCDGMLDDWDDDDDEDWNDTKWSDPNLNGHSKSHTDAVRITKCATELREQNDAVGITNVVHEPQVTIKETETNSSKGDQDYVRRMLLNDNKAGMTGLDKDKINQVIFEASKGSKYFENEKKKEEQMKKRIEEQKKKIQMISDEQLNKGKLEADRLLEDFEQQRDLTRCIVHIDMDAFYAAVEMRDDPSLINKPMAVGGKDMLSTSNYPARKFGVRAAMPGFIAKKLCPDLVIVPVNFEKYTAVSKEVKSILGEYDPNFCPMSLDEAYLDLTEHLIKRQNMSDKERTVICRDADYAFSVEHCHCDLNIVSQAVNFDEYSMENSSGHEYSKDDNLNNNESTSTENENSASEEMSITSPTNLTKGDNSMNMKFCPTCGKQLPPFKFERFGLTDEEALRELRTKIQQKTRLTASAGIAPNMMLAKVCSDKNKPNGQYKIPFTRNDVMNFIKDLPIKKIGGIGKVSEAMLNAIDVYTCTDLYNQRGLLYHLYSNISFNYFMRICIGIGSTTVERDSERKSMSTERTFSEISKPSDLYKKLEELSQSLSEDLKLDQLKGKTISIKIKTVNFQVRTRAHTVKDYTNTYEDIYQSAYDLLKTEIKQSAPQPLRLRLMGVRMSNLMPENLCQRKQQSTIIGAFKKMKKTKSEPGEMKRNVGETHSIVNSSENFIQEANNCHGYNDTHDLDVPSVTEQLMKSSDTGVSIFSGKKNNLGIDCVSGSIDIENKVAGTLKDGLESYPVETQVANSENSSVDTKITSSDYCLVETEVSKVAIETDCAGVNDIVKQNNTGSSISVVKESDSDIIGTEGQKQVGFDIVDEAECARDGKKFKNMSMNENDNVRLKNETGDDSISEMESFKVESNIDNTIIIHDDVKRVTRSGLSSTPRSNKKTRKRSGKTEEFIQHECPICCKMVLCKTLQGFNEHVDTCLEAADTPSTNSNQSERLVTCEPPLKLTSRTIADDANKCLKDTENMEDKPINKGNKTMEFKDNSNELNIDKKDIIARKGDNSKLRGNHSEKMTDNSVEHENCKQNLIEISMNTYDKLPVTNRHTGLENVVEVAYKKTGSKKVVDVETLHDVVNFETEKVATSSSSETVSLNSITTLNTYTNGSSKKNSDSSKTLHNHDDNDVGDSRSDIDDDNHNVVGGGHVYDVDTDIDCDRDCSVDLNIEEKVESDPSCNKTRILPLPEKYTGADSMNTNEKVSGNKILELDHNEDNADLAGYEIVDGKDSVEYRKASNVDGNLNYGVDSASISELQTDLDGCVTNLNPKCDNDSINNKEISKYDKDKCSILNTPNDVASVQSSSNCDYNKMEISTNKEKNCGTCNNVDVCLQPTEFDYDNDSNGDDNDDDSTYEVGSLLVCPVCNIGQKSADLHEFNVHVDTCLSRGAITEIIKEQNKAETTSLKRSLTTPGNSKPSKRRRTVTPTVQPKSCRSIASFFKTK